MSTWLEVGRDRSRTGKVEIKNYHSGDLSNKGDMTPAFREFMVWYNETWKGGAPIVI